MEGWPEPGGREGPTQQEQRAGRREEPDPGRGEGADPGRAGQRGQKHRLTAGLETCTGAQDPVGAIAGTLFYPRPRTPTRVSPFAESKMVGSCTATAE